MQTTYKKLIVFDINLDWKINRQEDRRCKDLPLVYSLIEKASKYQTIILQTSGCLIDGIDFINNNNINTGYLIASGGAIIYDIANKKIIDILNLNSDDVATLVHHGLMNNVNIGIYTSDRKFMYVANAVGYTNSQKRCYSPHEIINSYELLQKTLQRTDIVDISYLMFLGPIDNYRQNKLLYNIEKYWEGELNDIVIKSNKTSSYVHFGNKNSTKLKAIQKIMSMVGVEHLSDVLYIASSCVNNECYITFKNSLISSNPDFINEIGDKKHWYLNEEINKLDEKFGLETNSFWK